MGGDVATDSGQGGEGDEAGTEPRPPEAPEEPGGDVHTDATDGGSEAGGTDEIGADPGGPSTGDAGGEEGAPQEGGGDAGDDQGEPSTGTAESGRGSPPPEVVLEQKVAPTDPEEDETIEEEEDEGAETDDTPGGDDDTPDRSRFGGRTGEGKRKALKRGGGSQGSENAVALALQWLSKHQEKDGSWSPDQFMKHDPPDDQCTGPGTSTYRIGISGLALLCFLGAGHSSTKGEHDDVVARGVGYLLSRQNGEGGFGASPNMYEQAIATLVLVEVTALERHRGSSRGIDAILGKAASLRPGQNTFDAADRGVSFIVKAQQQGGGWDYSARVTDRNDMSISGWQMLTLVGAESIGIKIPGDVKKGVSRFLDNVSPRTGDANYTVQRGRAGGHSSSALTASALLTRIYLVGKPNDEVYRLADLVVAHPPSWGRMTARDSRQNFYTWYYGAMSLFQLGRERWSTWNRAMRPELVNNQQKKGSAAGSWDPLAQWASSGGRVYSTAMCCLCLEVYYRYARKGNY